MEHKIVNTLIAWKENKNRKPLLLYGARRVGETYTALAVSTASRASLLLVEIVDVGDAGIRKHARKLRPIDETNSRFYGFFSGSRGKQCS